MEGLPEGIESRFRYVLLVAKRAEQIIKGSPVRVKSKHSKPARIAMEEISRGQVKWAIAPPASTLPELPPESE